MPMNLLHSFKPYYREHGDTQIIELYTLKPGLYIKIDPETHLQETLFVKKEHPEAFESEDEKELYKWFRERDYYSSIISTQKTVRGNVKQLHNNNPLTLFAKSFNVLKSLKGKGKTFLDEAKIDAFFSTIVERDEEAPIIDFELIEKYREIILKSFSDLEAIAALDIEKIGSNDYVKLFIDADISIYKEMFDRYLKDKIFDNSAKEIHYDGQVFKRGTFNLTANAKKPMLLPHGTYFPDIFAMTLDDAVMFHKMMVLIRMLRTIIGEKEVCTVNKELYIPPDLDFFHINRVTDKSYANKDLFTRVLKFEGKNDGLILKSSELIPYFDEDKTFIIPNVAEVKKMNEAGEYIIEPDKKYKLKELEMSVQRAFFDGISILYTKRDEIKTKIPSHARGAFAILQNPLISFFHKDSEKGLKSVFEINGLSIVRSLVLREGLSRKTREAINLLLFFINYFKYGGDSVNVDRIENLRENIKEKIRQGIFSLDSDEQFYFLYGQLAYYLISLSKAQDKTGALYLPFLDKNNPSSMKSILDIYYQRFSHAILVGDNRLHKALGIVMSYSPERSKIRKEMIYAGLAAKNIFYEKANPKDGETENVKESEEIV